MLKYIEPTALNTYIYFSNGLKSAAKKYTDATHLLIIMGDGFKFRSLNSEEKLVK